MTTNVTDRIAGKTATDSRWSTQGSNFVLYIDDVGFEKIALHQNLSFAFAGNSSLIEGWKKWISNDLPGLPVVPRTEDCSDRGGAVSMSVCCVDIETKDIIFIHGCSHHETEAFFAGSGTISARRCWLENRDALKAVESAKNMDYYSGGTVKYLEFSNRENNIEESVGVKDLPRIALEKGMIMYPANQNQTNPSSMPLKEAAKLNKEVEQVVKQLEMGARSLSAPCEAMLTPWSEEERNNCGQALLRALKR